MTVIFWSRRDIVVMARHVTMSRRSAKEQSAGMRDDKTATRDDKTATNTATYNISYLPLPAW